MGWKSAFKKIGKAAAGTAIWAGAAVLLRKGAKATGRDFARGMVAAAVNGRLQPMTRREAADIAMDYASTALDRAARRYAGEWCTAFIRGEKRWPRE